MHEALHPHRIDHRRLLMAVGREAAIASVEEAQAYPYADELMVVTITGDYASRLRSYELLAAEFGLDPASPAAK